MNNIICIAPMMDWTDRHCRYFHRLLAPSALLYTEMVTSGAILHGDRDRLLAFDGAEHPVALQIGGSEPAELARSELLSFSGFMLRILIKRLINFNTRRAFSCESEC
jgi:tRNA-dihydrouridine synthase